MTVGSVQFRRWVGCIACVGLFASASRAEELNVPQRGAIASLQRQGQREQPQRLSVLVHIEPGANRGPVRAFAADHGAQVRYEYKTVMPGVINIRNLPEPAIAGLRNVPGVIAVQEDRYIANAVSLQDSIPLINGLQSQINVAGLSATGAGVRICVVDTGIDTNHIFYDTRIDHAAGFDFANNDSVPEDDNGHGAHVAGIAVGGEGFTVNFGCVGPEPFQGVAPRATLIGVKVLDFFGGGVDSDIIAGIDHCADPALPGGPADVINLSLGDPTAIQAGTCDGHVWAVAANNAVAAGVVVVAATGNECEANAFRPPACASGTIAVGATYDDSLPSCEDPTTTLGCTFLDCFCDVNPSVDDITGFSNQGDEIDVAAPGCVTYSAEMNDFAGVGITISAKCGTSMAAPHVTGLAALVLSADPTLTPAQVRQAIRDGATDMGTPGFDRAYGYGRIDVVNTLMQLGAQCESDAECEDGNACTVDSCDSATGCSNEPVQCSPGEACVNGACETVVCNNNGDCEAEEDCGNCPNDCISGGDGPSCGNGVCEPSLGEDCLSCGLDCRGKQNGKPSNRFCCGDGDGENPVGCGDSACGGGGFACSDTPVAPFCCGDGTCDTGEDHCNCALDCGAAAGFETDCADGIDNDCAGGTDCDDPDCVIDPACVCNGAQNGEPCVDDADCCSNKCKGRSGAKNCK